jgi:hypothetical protein
MRCRKRRANQVDGPLPPHPAVPIIPRLDPDEAYDIAQLPAHAWKSNCRKSWERSVRPLFGYALRGLYPAGILSKAEVVLSLKQETFQTAQAFS